MYIVHTGMHYVQFPNSADALGSLELYIVHTGYGLCTILVDPLRGTSCASLERPGSTRFHSPPHARAPWSSRSPSRFCPSPSGPPGKTPSDVATVMDFAPRKNLEKQRKANTREASLGEAKITATLKDDFVTVRKMHADCSNHTTS